ncbi:cell wall-binding repeat-containing protein [Georgenia sp. SYP-B2076]|uniref:cell wall-binding repeat-containing protein n=1 Tax=Georgenia sp. SYP-B2076 TaxID=2495881 RepID=UPI000F8F3743|nr:cell wall-binding repeat-containing protein [Georgenia sp. SYP-B2076]
MKHRLPRSLAAVAVAGGLVLTASPAQGADPGRVLSASAAQGAAPADDGASPRTIEIAPGTQAAVRDELAGMGVTPTFEFAATTDGFTADLTDSQAAALEALPAVESADEAKPMSILATQDDAPWGLDRIDQESASLDGRFSYPESAGRGVRVYVLDTGVTPLADFGGRVVAGADFTDDGRGTTTDCQGHGTHVAGTIASATYGVAKAATIVPLRVMRCDGAGLSSDVHEAIDWILTHHPAGTPGVVNLSIGGTEVDAGLEAAVRSAIRAGLTVVVAAGNGNLDAATTSPARIAEALTVGASTRADSRWVVDRAKGSNWGPRVDLFAPGAAITSLDHRAQGRSAVMSGTSMAAPHVSGAAALYLAAAGGGTPSAVAAALTGTASRVMRGAGDGSPGLLLNVRALPTGAVPAGLARAGGADRYETSATISAASFGAGVPVVYVATGSGYADALSGSSAAAHGRGPTLLVQTGAIPPSTTAELRRLRPASIVVLGGEGSVSGAVLDELRAFTGGAVTRLGGADRYETSALVSAATFAPGVPVAYVATGAGYADALSGAAAAGGRGPVLLTHPDGLPAAVTAELVRLRPATIVVLGGEGSVSGAVVDALGPFAGAVTRLGGADRYETSALVSAATFAPRVPVAYIATGGDYADALSGAAAAGGRGPVLLTPTDGLPAALVAELVRLRPATIVVLGGEGSVSRTVFGAMGAYLGS